MVYISSILALVKHLMQYDVEKFRLKWGRQAFCKNDKVVKKTSEEEELTCVKNRKRLLVKFSKVRS